MKGFVSRQDELDPVLSLATHPGTMALSYLPRTTHRFPQEKFPLKPSDK